MMLLEKNLAITTNISPMVLHQSIIHQEFTIFKYVVIFAYT